MSSCLEILFEHRICLKVPLMICDGHTPIACAGSSQDAMNRMRLLSHRCPPLSEKLEIPLYYLYHYGDNHSGCTQYSNQVGFVLNIVSVLISFFNCVSVFVFNCAVLVCRSVTPVKVQILQMQLLRCAVLCSLFPIANHKSQQNVQTKYLPLLLTKYY